MRPVCRMLVYWLCFVSCMVWVTEGQLKKRVLRTIFSSALLTESLIEQKLEKLQIRAKFNRKHSV